MSVGPKVSVARAAVVAVAVALVAAACSTSATVEAPSSLAMAPTATVGTPTATPAPTATPVPTATAAPTATPTPTPTPTPTATPVIPTDLLQTSIDENFELLDELGVQYSFAAFTADHAVIDERGSNLRLLPASNQKVVTAFGALELLDPTFRFLTQVRMDDLGNLYVVGGGDPTVTSEHISTLATRLARRMSRSLPEGQAPTLNDVVLDPTYFSPTRVAPGWPERYMPIDVGPMSGFMIDDNQHRGDTAYLADPDLGNAELLVRLFREAGFAVDGVARVGEVDPQAPVVAQRRSPSLHTMVGTILGRSDNEIAEALVRQIGLEHTGSDDIVRGKQVIHDHLSSLGLDLGTANGDGSGLSRLNRLSAQELVDVLILASGRAWWPTMTDGLADAGTDGTLGARLETDTTTGNVRAKTGTLHDVAALSGVLTTIDGAEVFFSFIVNGEAAEEAIHPLDQVIVAHASATISQLMD